jgi:hypothetical protein
LVFTFFCICDPRLTDLISLGRYHAQ